MSDYTRFFSESYTDARTLFQQCQQAAGATLDHVQLPGHLGPDGEALFIDFAWMGPRDADVVVLTVSGTHGAEGYCGSAVQSYAAEVGLFEKPPEGVAFLQIHASNPYGMAHGIRSNENLVDMNRNWIDFDNLPAVNPIYDEVMAGLPAEIEPTEATFAKWQAAFADSVARFGRWEVDNAMTSGQYHDPRGIEFGGSGPEWSRCTITRVLDELTGSARHIVYLDWHTLLRTGNGNLIFLCFNQTGDALYQRAGSWWGMEAIARETVNKQWNTGTSAGARRPSRHGLMMWGVQSAMAPQRDVAGAVIEFCTEPDIHFTPDELFVRETVCERYLQLSGDRSSRHWLTARHILRRSINPESAAFQTGVINAGSRALQAAIDGAAIWARENAAAEPGTITLSSAFE
ncbi:MAG: DUF2817 domain-containing protein [Pseudomonadota bacterium]